MNITTLTDNLNLHKYNKGHFFSKQGLAVIEYIFGKLVKYNGEFFELNKTISDNTGVSVRTVQRTVKLMQELEIIAVAPRRKVCPVTGKTVQSSNLIKVLEYKEFKVANEIVVGEVKQVEKKVEVIEVAQTVSTVSTKPSVRKPYSKKPIRVEIVPNWLGEEQEVKKATPEEQEAMRKLLGIA